MRFGSWPAAGDRKQQFSKRISSGAAQHKSECERGILWLP